MTGFKNVVKVALGGKGEQEQQTVLAFNCLYLVVLSIRSQLLSSGLEPVDGKTNLLTA